MSEDKKDPSSTSPAYDVMSPLWDKISTVLAGTEAMRAAGTKYLPQHINESDQAYRNRRETNTLFNQTQLTIDAWVGRPFSDPIKSVEVPEIFEPLLEDVDLQGNTVGIFARNWFHGGIAKGLHHILVDFPRLDPTIDGRPRTLADDRKERRRPYWVDVPPENLLFAHAETINGEEVVTHARILEYIEVLDGFTLTITPQIRVLTPGHVELWRQVDSRNLNNKIEWKKHDQFDIDLQVVPLVTFYSDRTGFMVSKPPLLDLVNLNIRHWQSTSDQNAVLTVARFPILAASGGIDDENVTIGPHHWLWSPDPVGKFYYVEHTGKAIAAGAADLAALETQMSQYGAEFLKKRPGNMTATARALDSAEATSPLQDMTIRFQNALNLALQYSAAWVKEKGPLGLLEVSTDFGPEKTESADLTVLTSARVNKDISRSSFLEELKRRGILSDEFDAKVDAKLIEKEGKAAFEKAQKMAPLQPTEPPSSPNPVEPAPVKAG